jgi:hypothetical protein
MLKTPSASSTTSSSRGVDVERARKFLLKNGDGLVVYDGKALYFAEKYSNPFTFYVNLIGEKNIVYSPTKLVIVDVSIDPPKVYTHELL